MRGQRQAFGRASVRLSGGTCQNACHPEQSEGSWFLPPLPVYPTQANTKIPRYARHDKYSVMSYAACFVVSAATYSRLSAEEVMTFISCQS
jgi:hypothetical protein